MSLPVEGEEKARRRWQALIMMMAHACSEMPNRFIRMCTSKGRFASPIVAWLIHPRYTLTGSMNHVLFRFPAYDLADMETPR